MKLCKIFITLFVAGILFSCSSEDKTKDQRSSLPTEKEENLDGEVEEKEEPKPEPTIKVVSLSLDEGAVALPVGALTHWKVIAVFEDETEEDVTADVTWSFGDAALLEVVDAETGLIKANAEGETTLTASFGGKSAEKNIEVYDAIMLSLDITATVTTVTIGGADLQLKAEAYFSDGQTYDLTEVVNWTSVTPAKATVSNTSPGKGLVHAVAAGQVTINAVHAATSTLATIDLDIVP